jgi:hypothetical protein
MSYYTQVQLVFEGASYFAAVSDEKIQPMLAAAAAAFDLYPPRGVNPFLPENPADWFSDRLILMSGYRTQAAEFLKYMSLKFPGVRFSARGLGEEFDDVWVSSYLSGEEIAQT